MCFNLGWDTPIVTKLEFLPDDGTKKDCNTCHNALAGPDLLEVPFLKTDGSGKWQRTVRCYECGKHVVDDTQQTQ
jgi:hypothetical protein